MLTIVGVSSADVREKDAQHCIVFLSLIVLNAVYLSRVKAIFCTCSFFPAFRFNMAS